VLAPDFLLGHAGQADAKERVWGALARMQKEDKRKNMYEKGAVGLCWAETLYVVGTLCAKQAAV
jgi:hypothetical protein